MKIKSLLGLVSAFLALAAIIAIIGILFFGKGTASEPAVSPTPSVSPVVSDTPAPSVSGTPAVNDTRQKFNFVVNNGDVTVTLWGLATDFAVSTSNLYYINGQQNGENSTVVKVSYTVADAAVTAPLILNAWCAANNVTPTSDVDQVTLSENGIPAYHVKRSSDTASAEVWLIPYGSGYVSLSAFYSTETEEAAITALVNTVNVAAS